MRRTTTYGTDQARAPCALEGSSANILEKQVTEKREEAPAYLHGAWEVGVGIEWGSVNSKWVF
jgi:hypothetical protein